jgi:hypothetical protein
MILENNTTTVLNILEEHRQKLNKTAFRSLILLLTTEFNDPSWNERIDRQETMNENSRGKSSKRQLITKSHIDQCSLIVLCYIVSVMNKYKIAAPDPIWTQILNNSLTKTITVNKNFILKIKILLFLILVLSFFVSK